MSLYRGTGATLDARLVIALAVAVVVAGIAVAFIRGQVTFLPDVMADTYSADVPYACGYCSRQHLYEACGMTKAYYRHEYVSGEVAEQWRTKNPNAFVEILNRRGELCGCFGILALTDTFREAFMSGREADTQLNSDQILGPKESKKADHLYISGVVVRAPGTLGIGARRAWVLVWTIVTYLRRVYKMGRERTLFAIAANKESERFMEDLGFKLVMSGKDRVDKCNLYEFRFSHQSVEDLLRRIGDLSRTCVCKF